MTMKRSVAVAILDERRPGRVLVVQRPDDDEDLPGAWGLPAASLLPGESWEDAVRRAGRDKLGIELAGIEPLNQGELPRAAYNLTMRLYCARIADGRPDPRRAPAGVTRYQDWAWGVPADLEPAAAQGSLCCRLYLRNLDAGAGAGP